MVSVDVNLATERATLHYLDDVATLDDFSRAVGDAGYSVEGIAGEEEEERDRERLARTRLIKDQRNRFLVAGGLGVVIFLGSFKEWFPWMPSFLQNWYVLWALATPVQFWAGAQFYKGAWSAARHGTTNMNTLIALGTGVAYAFSATITLFPDLFAAEGVQHAVYFDTAAIIIALVLLGRFLEARARGQTSEAIRKLMGLRPKTARVVRGDAEIDVPIEQVVVGDLVLVRPGESVPVDGEVTRGASAIDESMLSGESIPVDKEAGSPVYAATINKTGSFQFRATKVGKDTRLVPHHTACGRGARLPGAHPAPRRCRIQLLCAGCNGRSRRHLCHLAAAGAGPGFHLRPPQHGGRARHRLPLRLGPCHADMPSWSPPARARRAAS